jgi:hypothetical protein
MRMQFDILGSDKTKSTEVFGKYSPNKTIEIPASENIRTIRIKADKNTNSITNIMFITEKNTTFEFRGTNNSESQDEQDYNLLPGEQIVGCYGYTKTEGIELQSIGFIVSRQ